MATVPSYLDDYRRRGYAVVRGVFAPAEIAELAAAFDRLHREALSHPRSFRHGNQLFRLGTDPALGRIVRLVQWPSYGDPVLERFRLDRRVRDIVAPLIGGDVKQIINQMHWKPPGAAAAEFGYHQDIRFRRPRSAYREPQRAYVQTGIAIDPHRLDNGPMMFHPDSHRRGELALGQGGAILDQAMAADDLARVGLDPARVEPMLLEPGRRRAVGSVRGAWLGAEPVDVRTGASISTATSPPSIATVASGPSATASPARSARPCWCITRICTAGPNRIISTSEARSADRLTRRHATTWLAVGKAGRHDQGTVARDDNP
ncbi:MAG: phytanoyl-CoA dioxygenase family protein [Pseudomonadota bacterium]